MMRPPLPTPTLEIATGVHIPQLGFGTFKVAPDDAQQAVMTALELGYRHIDTAAMYRNEREVGQGLAASGLPREDLFVTTKLDNPYHEPDAARAAFERSLDDLGLDYLDLYLIHWPLAKSTNMVATWETLIEILGTGRTRAIGVSNYTEAHLDEIISATGVVPAVNQVEINPYLTQEPLRAYHAERGIVTQSWSPLARGRCLDDPVLVELAEETGHTVAQVVVRWHLQHGLVVFPKSINPARIEENSDVFGFELTDEQMARIDAMNRNERSGSAPDAMELK